MSSLCVFLGASLSLLLWAYSSVLGFCRWHLAHWASPGARCGGVGSCCSGRCCRLLSLPSVSREALPAVVCAVPCHRVYKTPPLNPSLKHSFCCEAYELWPWLVCQGLLCWWSVPRSPAVVPVPLPPSIGIPVSPMGDLQCLFVVLVHGMAQQGLTGSHQWC